MTETVTVPTTQWPRWPSICRAARRSGDPRRAANISAAVTATVPAIATIQ
jgi:hypothetical protein